MSRRLTIDEIDLAGRRLEALYKDHGLTVLPGEEFSVISMVGLIYTMHNEIDDLYRGSADGANVKDDNTSNKWEVPF